MFSELPKAIRWLLLIGVSLAFGALLLFHHVLAGPIYEELDHQVTTWQVVHVAFLFFIGLMALAVYALVGGLEGKAAAISRAALGPFVLFYGAFEAATGIGTGVLVSYANGLPEVEREVAAGMIEAYFYNPLAGNPSVVSVLGMLAWVTALTSAAVGFWQAGAPRSVPVLLVLAGLLFGYAHVPPLGPLGLALFVVAAVRLEAARRPFLAPGGEGTTHD